MRPCAARTALFGLFLGGIGYRQTGGVVVYVDARAAGAADGSSWADAFIELHEGLDAVAAAGGGEIRIAQGTYVPSRRFATGDDDPDDPRAVTFLLPDGVTLRGGYAGLGAADPDAEDPDQFPTIFSGDVLGDDAADFQNREDNAYHVVMVVDANVMLEGLFITAGNADYELGWQDYRTTHKGGGLYQQGGSLIISNCTFHDNSAGDEMSTVVAEALHAVCRCSDGGAGLYAAPDRLVIRNCRFMENRSTCGGGAQFAGKSILIEDSHFEANVADGGSAIAINSDAFVARKTLFRGNPGTAELGCGIAAIASHLEFDECTFAGHDRSALIAGAITMEFRDCTFSENAGGALSALGFQSLNLRRSSFRNNARGIIAEAGEAALIEGCTFDRNGPGLWGAYWSHGVGKMIVRRSVFSNNRSERGGGAINGASGTIESCEFTNNIGSSGGAVEGIELSILYSTFLSNEAEYDGGAIKGDSIRLQNCHFSRNRAGEGGAAVIDVGHVEGCFFGDNWAE